MKLLVIAAYDSQLKVASYLSKEFLANSWRVDVRVPKRERGQLSRRQIVDYSEFSNIGYCKLTVSSILENIQDYSAVLVLTNGRLTQEICFEFGKKVTALTVRPILITGFVGVNLFDTCVGYQRRLHSDVIFMNAQKDYDDCMFVAKALGFSGTNVVASGLPFIGEIKKKFDFPDAIETVVFAGQPDVPERIVERVYILSQLIEYARRFPERQVYLKPRHKPSEKSIHYTRHHYEILLKTYLRKEDIPSNFAITYKAIDNLLDDTQLFLTVSSTAALEALAKDCHVAILADLGISERFGNKYFIGSGMLTTFQKLGDEVYSLPDPDWLSYHVGCDGVAAKVIFERTIRLVDKQATEHLPFFSSELLENIFETRSEVERLNVSLVRNVFNTGYYYIVRLFSKFVS